MSKKLIGWILRLLMNQYPVDQTVFGKFNDQCFGVQREEFDTLFTDAVKQVIGVDFRRIAQKIQHLSAVHSFELVMADQIVEHAVAVQEIRAVFSVPLGFIENHFGLAVGLLATQTAKEKEDD